MASPALTGVITARRFTHARAERRLAAQEGHDRMEPRYADRRVPLIARLAGALA